MARGRCVGCGYENVSSAKVKRHIAGCEDYAKVYQQDPTAALEPEEAMEVHRAFKKSAEGAEAKDGVRAERLDRWTTFQETKSELARERWSKPGAGADLKGVPLTPEEVLALDGARMYGDRISAADMERTVPPTRRVILQGFVGSV